MSFTNETLKRALRTFFQSAVAYLLVNISVCDFTNGREAVKSALLGLVISSLAAGIAAVMNLEIPEKEDVDE